MLVLGGPFLVAAVLGRALDPSPPRLEEKDAHCPLGWFCALGASLLFGTVWLPYMLHSAEQSDVTLRPFYVGTYSSFGIGLSNLLLSLILRYLGLLQQGLTASQLACGALGALDVNIVGMMAYQSSRLAGITAAPVILSSTGMITSYLWGVAVFEEEVASRVGSGLGLLALMAGAAACAVARTDLPRKWARPLMCCCPSGLEASVGGTGSPRAIAGSSSQGGTSTNNRTTSKTQLTLPAVELASGFCIAMGAGLLDGSLMVPFKAFGMQNLGPDEMLAKTKTAQLAFEVTKALSRDLQEGADALAKPLGVPTPFLRELSLVAASGAKVGTGSASAATKAKPRHALKLSIAAAIPGVHARAVDAQPYLYLQGSSVAQLLLSSAMLAALRAMQRWSNEPSSFAACEVACRRPGLLAGLLWAAGNFCSICAVEYLGVALAFPLSQTCVVISALWGILLCGEMPRTPQRLACLAGIFAVITGSFMLATFG